MKIIHNYNEDDVLAKLLLLYFAFQHFYMGFDIFRNDFTPLQSLYIEGLSYLLPMDVWGVLLMISATAFILTVLQENRLEYYFLLLAGVTGALTFGILAMASLELSMYQSNTINYIIIASIDAVLAIVGGVAVWLRRI